MRAKVCDGVLEAHVENFFELVKLAQYFHQGPSAWYFRGHADESWKLETTLERFEKTLSNYVRGTNKTLISEFKKLLRGNGIIPRIDLSTNEELYAWGQHYGLPTPLLDWSESFFIALFFAVADAPPRDAKNSAIWGIQTSAKEVMTKFNESNREKINSDPDEFPEFKFLEAGTDANTRLISQAGLFVQKPNGLDIEDIIKKSSPGNSTLPVLAKITFPTQEREHMINNLFAMNINWATIYRGAEGAAMHSKMKLQMLDLKVKKMGKERTLEHAGANIFTE
ncbi:FRG domain-containing protein [Herbaspirillum frisingense]|uniref:FRG domain-containing protein n=1 Tax=Herbaspirillum frisingense TaxID=92645 RepID=A0ABU1PHY7_9BURK|nr:FRG domain-containing protein [Herbaspirillum frisingense]MDR6585560.1 hypothetical protein [Herbaspirillum frisingense]